MKQTSIFLMLIFSFSLIFTSCGDGSGSTSLSDEDVSGIANALFGVNYWSQSYIGTYEPGTNIDGELIVTGTESSTTVTFNDFGVDIFEDGTDDIIIDGALTYDGDITTITFLAFTITAEGESISINGYFSIDATSLTVNITFTGTGYGSFTITMDAKMDEVMINSITYASINGTDYTSQFQDALAEY